MPPSSSGVNHQFVMYTRKKSCMGSELANLSVEDFNKLDTMQT